MPLTYPPQGELEVVERFIPVSPPNEPTYITSDWVGKYNLLYLPSAYPEEPLSRPLYLPPNITDKPNAEIIIRNYGYTFSAENDLDKRGEPVFPSGLGNKSIALRPIEGVWIEYGADLGPYIQWGGIMELKRLGSTNTWSAYGYIFGWA